MKTTSKVSLLIFGALLLACGGASSFIPNSDVVTLGDTSQIQNKIGANTFVRRRQSLPAAFSAATNLARTTGFKILRIDVRMDYLTKWNGSSKTTSDYDEAWNESLNRVDTCFRSGLVPLITIQTVNGDMPDTIFGNPGTEWGWPTTEDTKKAYSDFAAKYASKIRERNPNSDFIIQVGNELTNNPDWPTKKEHYSDVLFSTIEGINTAVPRAIVIPTGFSFYESNNSDIAVHKSNGSYPVEAVSWLMSKPKASLLKGIAVHGYNSIQNRVVNGDSIAYRAKMYAPEALIFDINQIRAMTTGKLLIVTETGVNSHDYIDDPISQSSDPTHFLQASQAAYDVRSLLVGITCGADIVTLYELSDRGSEFAPDYGAKSRELFYGIYNEANLPKTSGTEIKKFLSALSGYHFVTLRQQVELKNGAPLWSNNYLLYEAEFQNSSGQKKFVRWTDRPEYSSDGPENTHYPRLPSVNLDSLQS